MTTRTPMPSPRGTNFAQLFLPDRTAMAMDAAPRRYAHDGATREQLDRLLAPLKGKVTEWTLKAIENDLANHAANGGSLDEDPDQGRPDDDEVSERERRENGLGADGLTPRVRQMMRAAWAEMYGRSITRANEMFPGLNRIRRG